MKEYFYNGNSYSVSELSKLSGIKPSIIYKRLGKGWNIEDAVETPVGTSVIGSNGGEKREPVNIIFHRYIPEVFREMQPTLEKVYAALPNVHNINDSGGCRQHFIITLESGKPLVVYPGEFEVIGEVED